MLGAYLLSITSKHGIDQFDAVRQAGRNNVAGPERAEVMRKSELKILMIGYFTEICKSNHLGNSLSFLFFL